MTDGSGRPEHPTGPTRPRAVLSVGKFDGVHAGHRHLVGRLVQVARQRGAEPIVLILDPHPQSVLTGKVPEILTTVAERKRRLASIGVGHAETFAFTADVAALSPEQFAARLLAHFDLVAVVVGPDFGFGRGRTGNVATLQTIASAAGYHVEVVPHLEVEGDVVSSRRIRALLVGGQVRSAQTLLCRPHMVEGDVVRGAARGRDLGFPTANLYLTEPFVLPGNGIYAVRSRWTDAGTARRADGVASVGVRPTFDNGERLLEVFLLDHDEDLYGQRLGVEFIEYLRPETRFDTVDDLIRQMRVDVEQAREALGQDARIPRAYS